MNSIDQARKVAQRECDKQIGRIGEQCEHYSGCEKKSEYAEGYWYPRPAGCVMCEEHVHLGRGDRVHPNHPRYPTGWGTS